MTGNNEARRTDEEMGWAKEGSSLVACTGACSPAARRLAGIILRRDGLMGATDCKGRQGFPLVWRVWPGKSRQSYCYMTTF